MHLHAHIPPPPENKSEDSWIANSFVSHHPLSDAPHAAHADDADHEVQKRLWWPQFIPNGDDESNDPTDSCTVVSNGDDESNDPTNSCTVVYREASGPKAACGLARLGGSSTEHARPGATK